MNNLKLALLLVILSSKLFSQVENIRTFQYSSFDIAGYSDNFIESGFLDFESTYLNRTDLYFHGGYNFSSRISIGAELKYAVNDFTFDESNAVLVAKYNIVDDDIKVSIGPYYEINQENMGIWGVYRQELMDKLGFISKASLIFESSQFDKYYITIGAGVIYQYSENLYLVGECNYTSPMNYPNEFLMISGGINYILSSRVSIRGVMGYNILDTSLQYMFNGGLAYSF